MDYHGHVLSLKAISVVRSMQNLGPYSQDSIFASASTISRCSRIIERYGKSVVDYTLSYVSEELGGGECLTFRIDQALPLILKVTELEDAATSSSAMISGSMDGVNIWRGYDLIIFGLKNNSDMGCTPFTKRRNVTFVNDKVVSTVQSPDFFLF